MCSKSKRFVSYGIWFRSHCAGKCWKRISYDSRGIFLRLQLKLIYDDWWLPHSSHPSYQALTASLMSCVAVSQSEPNLVSFHFCFLLVSQRSDGVPAWAPGKGPWPWAMQMETLWLSATEGTILSVRMEMPLQAPVRQSATVRIPSQLPPVVTTSQWMETKMFQLRMERLKCSWDRTLPREQADRTRTAPWRPLPHPPPLLLLLPSQTPRGWPKATFHPPSRPRHPLLYSPCPSAVSTVTSTPPFAAPVDNRSAHFSRIQTQGWDLARFPILVLIHPVHAASLPAHTLIPILLTHPPLSVSITTINSAGRSIPRTTHMHLESGMAYVRSPINALVPVRSQENTFMFFCLL